MLIFFDFFKKTYYYRIMKKRYDNLAEDLSKILHKIEQGTATDSERALADEIVLTIAIKGTIADMLSNLPMPQKEFAEKINVKPPMITAYKKGEKIPSLQTFLMMLRVLDDAKISIITDGQFDIAYNRLCLDSKK